MSRVPRLSPDTMTEAQREVHDEIVSGPHGRVVGPCIAWLQSPELARRARGLSEFIRFNAAEEALGIGHIDVGPPLEGRVRILCSRYPGEKGGA